MPNAHEAMMVAVTATTWLSILGLLVWVGFEVVLRRRSDREAASWHGAAEDRGSTVLLMAAYGSAVVLTVALDVLGVGRLPAWARWTGVALIVAGLGLRAWSMAVLGRFYTRTLRVVGGQRVVTTGPYRLIRHPGYAGSLLVWTGYCLGAGNWISLIVVVALMVAAYGWRIRSEERLLADAFGDEYTSYQRHTARLLPLVY
jgi:protein-S-isoprenylcysteine O-methyltransferase Ste14